MSVTVDTLLIEVEGKSTGASSSIDKATASLNKLKYGVSGATTGLNKSTMAFAKFAAKVTVAVIALRKISEFIGEWIQESNAYVENLNLFTASLGEYAAEAKKYAEEVSEVMGIDPSEWIRNQGIFNTLIEGFGLGSEAAAKMSKNLTQLGYDLSSFFNLEFADAMTKLQSGVSGELEPLRRLGYDLSQAKLQAIALSFGIDKAFNKMTQGEKVMLRYHAIMTQVTVAQGDMARTLIAPANQLRILKSQAVQASRALGNIFIPALNAILPYAIAFLKILRMVAQSIAQVFGFSMPVIDYSGLEDVAGGASDVSDALDSATGSAKALKNATLGFDELNIIQPETASGGGGGGIGDIGGSSMDIPIAEYDFVDNAVTNRVNEIVEKFTEWLPIIKKVGEALLLLAGAAIIGKVIKGFMNLAGAIGSAGAMGIFSYINTLLLGFIASMIQAEIVTYNFALRGDSVEGILIALAIGIGGVGTALTLMLGPIGWVIGAIGALVGIAIGLSTAYEEMVTQLVATTFYENTGVAITDLADNFVTLADAISDMYEPFNENNQIIEDTAYSIQDSKVNFDNLVQGIKDGTFKIEETVPKISQAFDTLESDLLILLQTIQTNLLLYLSGTTGSIVEAVGGDLSDYREVVTGVTDDTIAKIKSLKEEADKIEIKLTNAETEADAQRYADQLNDIYNQMFSLSGISVDPVKDFTNAMALAKDGIEWDSPQSVIDAFDTINEAMAGSKAVIDENAGLMTGYIDTLIANATDPADIATLRAAKLDIIEAATFQKGELDIAFQGFGNVVATNLVGDLKGVVDAAMAEFEKMSPFDQAMQGGQGEYVRKAMKTYKEDIVDPMISQMTTINGTLGTKLAGDMSSIFTQVLDELIDYEDLGNIMGVDAKKAFVAADIETVLEPILESLGGNLDESLAASIEANSGQVGEAMKGVALYSQDTFKGWMDIHSPSGVMEGYGLNIDQGLANGITDNAGSVSSAFSSMLNRMIKAMGRFVNNIGDAIDKLMENMAKAMRGVSSFSSFRMPYISVPSIPAYATGGFPEDGLFFANSNEIVGTFANGQTAVANNSQIIDGVSQGVARAVASVLGGQNSNDRPLEVKVYIDGKQVTESVEKYQQGRGVQILGGAY